MNAIAPFQPGAVTPPTTPGYLVGEADKASERPAEAFRKTAPALSAQARGQSDNGIVRPDQPNSDAAAAKQAQAKSQEDTSPGSESDQLDAKQQEQLRELRARDRQVRAHERAHLAAAGPHAQGGPSFSYQTGPDNRRYAVSGEVRIDTSPVPGDPAATLQKAQQIQRAALAPAEPSAQDRQVAAQAAAMAAQARAELSKNSLSGNATETYAGTQKANDPAQLINLVA